MLQMGLSLLCEVIEYDYSLATAGLFYGNF